MHIDTIYSGVASPTDAAAVGVILSVVLAWWNSSLSFSMLKEGLWARQLHLV
jgi:C4-dicarboxylate transporter DctM subunit